MTAADKRAAKRGTRKNAAKTPAKAHRATPKKPAYSEIGLRKARLIQLFFEKHLVHLDGEWAFKAFILATFQLENIILPIFANVDAKGRRKVRKALISLPRWGGKSEILAGIVLALMFLEPKYKGQYYIVARDKEQARIIFDKAKTMVMRDPMLRRACTCKNDIIIVNETGAKFQVLPGERKAVEGKHADVCLIDEYHVHKDDGIYNAMASGMVGSWKSGGLLLVASTAGHERKGPLWDLIPKLKKDPRGYVYWIGADDDDDPRDPKTWRKANPMPWVTLGELREAFNTLPIWEFERYHLNRFPSAGISKAFNARDWDRMKALPIIDPAKPSVLGVDASFSRDTTAFVLDQVDAKGYHNWLAWIIKSEEPGIPINREYMKSVLLKVVTDYYVERVACDPNYFVLEMLELANSHGVPVEVFRQSPPNMAKAYDVMWAVVEGGRGRHGGNEGFREHIVNAGKEPTAYGPRLTKIQESLKIDAAVAGAIATTVAESEYQLNGAGPQIAVF